MFSFDVCLEVVIKYPDIWQTQKIHCVTQQNKSQPSIRKYMLSFSISQFPASTKATVQGENRKPIKSDSVSATAVQLQTETISQ